MSHQPTDWIALGLEGVEPCLDFVNTVGGTRAEPTEYLGDYGDLVGLASHLGVLEAEPAAALLAAASHQPAAAAAVHRQALTLREALFRLLAGDQAPVADADLAAVNEALATALLHQRLQSTDDGWRLTWSTDTTDLARPLWPLVRSAVDLLTGPELGRVHRCASPTCDWLFLDRSRNQSRRWCSMADCGNQAKARRHYYRQRGNRPPAGLAGR